MAPILDNASTMLSAANIKSTAVLSSIMSGATSLGTVKKNEVTSTAEHKQMFDFRESLVIATVVSVILLLFACLLLWLCNKTHQIVQDGDLEKGEKLFEEMLNPDYKEAFLNKKTGIYNKCDRKRYII